jgi:putative ABC transport system permease protein
VDPGFNPERAMTAKVTVSGDRYEEDATVRAFFNQLLDRLREAPGVETAGGVSFLPMAGLGAATIFEVVGEAKPPMGQEPVCDVRVVTGDYFGAMGIPLLEGRHFERGEQTDKANVVIVNETLARQHWPGESAIGKHIVVSWGTDDADEIVGVVGDVRLSDLETAARPTIYWPQGRSQYPWTALVVRTHGDPAPAASLIRREVRALDASVPVADVRTLDEIVARSVAQRRLVMVLLGIFAAVALLLAAVGIYGVMAYVVAQRTREMGVRMALGARPRDVLKLVVGRAFVLAVIGVTIGTAVARAVTRYMTTLLFATEPGDPLILATVGVVLVLAALAASYIPGRTATRVDPLVALRAE